MYLCDTVMGICDSYSSGFGYKSAHMKGNVHHSTCKEIEKNDCNPKPDFTQPQCSTNVQEKMKNF